jgi:hypothetical protein
MITVNSISGGKTSAYMAAKFPADYNVFALVTIDDPVAAPKDKGLVKLVSDKIGKEFIATAEDDKTLRVVLELEQFIGTEIKWLTGISFDNLIEKRKAVPNKSWRFCTSEMKMRPIWDWWYKEIGDKIEMRVGIRYDEKERAERLTTSFKGVVGKTGDRNKWEEIEWRTVRTPLIEYRIIHPTVVTWASSTVLDFPEDSNCVGCFWKSEQQLRRNWDTNPNKMQWFANQEKRGTFKDGITYEQIKDIGLQLDFAFGEGAGCQAGYCTD